MGNGASGRRNGGNGGNLVEEAGGIAVCAHCNKVFRFDPADALKLVGCPHCRMESALGEKGLESLRNKAHFYIGMGVVFLLLGVGVTVGTLMVSQPGGHFILYFGGFIAGVLYLVKGSMLRSVKMSKLGDLAEIYTDPEVPESPIWDVPPPYPGTHK